MLKVDARAFCDASTAVATVPAKKKESIAQADQAIQTARVKDSSGLEEPTSNADAFAGSSDQSMP
eukprot:scaffold6795_cov114-Isochrysis_galbana.AAC.1